MTTFNSIDVETANPDRASICQIGVVHVRDGVVVDRWQSLVNPEDWFNHWNVSIHGINEEDVRKSPTLPEVIEELHRRLHDSVLISHSSFDRVAFEQATTRYSLEPLSVRWLDSSMIVRRAWPERYGQRGYSLKNVAKDLAISFKHHNALEDARVAAEIVLRACADTQTDIEDWLPRVTRPTFASTSRATRRRNGDISTSKAARRRDGDTSTSRAARRRDGDTSTSRTARRRDGDISTSRTARRRDGDISTSKAARRRDGDTSTSRTARRREANAEGPLFGETLVFTGRLCVSRREAADMAANAGCNVTTRVTKKTTLLVVGIKRKPGSNRHNKSTKHRKAESLIQKGVDIQILSETDFLELIGVT